MDIFESGIPNLQIRNYGTILKPLEIVEARIFLEAWDEYLYKHMESGREITDKKIKLQFDCYNPPNPVDCTPEINAYNLLVENQFQIRDNILKALTEEVGRLTESLDPNDSFVPNITPETRTDFDFRPFIGPEIIHFTEESKDDVSYLEWHFQCEWDEEHGFAVTTHGERVIHIDQDTDIWKIYEDKGTLAEERRKYAEQMKNAKPRIVKPWWQFW